MGVLYSLDKKFAHDEGDTKHLESRKNYLFRAAFWSSAKPPELAKVAKYLPDIKSKQFAADKHDARKFEPSTTLKPAMSKSNASTKGAYAKMSSRVWPWVRVVVVLAPLFDLTNLPVPRSFMLNLQ